MRQAFLMVSLVLAGLAAVPHLALAQFYPTSWDSAKRRAGQHVYTTNHHTLYCGCDYTPNPPPSRSGVLDMVQCGTQQLRDNDVRASRMEWEHIVPASLMPARQSACWTHPHQFPRCVSASGNVKRGRNCCKTANTPARDAMLDLHNLAPSVGEINMVRSNDRYGIVEDGGQDVDEWPGCGAQHGHPEGIQNHRFEPPDCVKGDVARVWFYMHDQHGVVIPDAEWNMFVDWSDADPVSAWEIERDQLIADEQGNHNPYVEGADPDPDGLCDWDPVQ